MDPVFDTTLRGALALLFLGAALHKLRAPGEFRATLAAYRLLPERGTRVAAAAIAGAELATGAALLLPAFRKAGALAALLLLCAYSLAISVNLARGRREIDCGCSGPTLRQPLRAWLLARNLALGAGALLCLVPVQPRPLLWIDGVSGAGGIAVLAAVYVSTNRLLAGAPALARLRES